MGGMNRMEASPEAAWEEDPKHHVGNAGTIREGAVMACVRPRGCFALRVAFVP
jgi:hypothetical protein